MVSIYRAYLNLTQFSCDCPGSYIVGVKMELRWSEAAEHTHVGEDKLVNIAGWH